MEILDGNELPGEDDQREESDEYDEDYYSSLVSGPYMHIFLENFRKEVQKSSAKKKKNMWNNKGGDGNNNNNFVEIIEPPPKHEPPPNPLPADNLKSAMKSSSTSSSSGRKKDKGRPRKAVTWAPDVYDPPPSSESHYISASNHGIGSSTTGSGEWHGRWQDNKIKGKNNWQQRQGAGLGVDKATAGDGVEGYKNPNNKSGKNEIKGGDKCDGKREVEKHKNKSKKSQKNQQKDADTGATGGGAKDRKNKDKKIGGGGDNGGKDKEKKFGKIKGANKA